MSVQTGTTTAAAWHEIHSPWANSDQMHDVLVIQRSQRSSCFIEADLKTTLNLLLWGWSCRTSTHGTGGDFALLSSRHPAGCLTYPPAISPLHLLLPPLLPLLCLVSVLTSSSSFFLESLNYGFSGASCQKNFFTLSSSSPLSLSLI